MIEPIPLYSDVVRTYLTRRLLQRGHTTTTMDEVAEELGIPRTPVREALGQLQAVGMITVRKNRGVSSLFRGPDDILVRSRVLAAAIAAGAQPVGRSRGERISTSTCGCWDGWCWDILEAWPSAALTWGLDLRPRSAAIAECGEHILTASTPSTLGRQVAEFGKLVADYGDSTLPNVGAPHRLATV